MSKLTKPSPAMVLAAIALIFAMAGTAIAGTGAVDRFLTKSKVKSIARKQADKELKANVTGSHVNTADTATTATTANNANQLNGQNADAYASSSTAVRYARIDANGTVVGAESKGISQANVSHPNPGQYCINGLSPAPQGAVISAAFGSGLGSQYFAEITPSGAQFCAGLQVGIATYNSANASTDENFTIAVYTN